MLGHLFFFAIKMVFASFDREHLLHIIWTQNTLTTLLLQDVSTDYLHPKGIEVVELTLRSMSEKSK